MLSGICKEIQKKPAEIAFFLSESQNLEKLLRN